MLPKIPFVILLVGLASLVLLLVLTTQQSGTSKAEANSPRMEQASPGEAASPLTMIVMDPLCAPLSCPCVEGYAQRDYGKLANWLEQKLSRPIKLCFNPSLAAAVQDETSGQADIVIGKSSVVAFDARSIQRSLIAVAKLTDKQGRTTQSGLIVVAKDGPATTASELQDYRFFLGPPDSDEKHKAVLRLLEKNGISALENEQFAICNACSEGATKVLELQRQSVRAATAISSYAAPLLEGCGTVPPDSLRVIAKTKPVPFIEAFVSPQLSEGEQDRITDALLAAADDPELCTALESLAGFIPMNESAEFGNTQLESRNRQAAIEIDDDNPQASIHEDEDEGVKEWTQWRGVHRHARVPSLPDNPGAEAKVVWRNPLTHQGLGGIAATEDLVVFGDRDIDDTHDVWRCLDSFTGAELWQVKILARANLDYGNSPRTTPLIHEDKVYLLGALGDLLCVDLASGEIHWQCNLRDRFGATSELTWGYCGSPLLVDNLLIVAPGAKDASIVALDESSGGVVWKTPGSGPSYGSLIVGTFGGKKQIVGHDAVSLGGWDVSSGKRLWSVVPDVPGDFNVPTPLSFDGKLLVCTENNGTRLFEFNQDGTIDPSPIAVNQKLRPNMSTPTIVGDRLFCVNRFLYCLDLGNDLKEIWKVRPDGISAYGSIIASERRLLVVANAQLLYLPTDGARKILAQQKVSDQSHPIYSHPAIVGKRLFLRTDSAIICIEL